jgi:hypothetical protein
VFILKFILFLTQTYIIIIIIIINTFLKYLCELYLIPMQKFIVLACVYVDNDWSMVH